MAEVVFMNVLYFIIVVVLLTVILFQYGLEAAFIGFLTFVVFLMTFYVIGLNTKYYVVEKLKKVEVKLEEKLEKVEEKVKDAVHKVEDKVVDVADRISSGLGQKVRSDIDRAESKFLNSARSGLSRAKQSAKEIFE